MSTEQNMKVSIDRAKTLVEKSLLNAIDRKITPPNIFIHGTMGMGKTESMYQMCRDLSVKLSRIVRLVDVRLSSYESHDVQGIPYTAPNGKFSIYEFNGNSVKVEERTMFFSTPHYWPEEDSDEIVVILFDEFSNASKNVQQSAYRVLQERTLNNGKKLGDNVMIIAAGNLPSDNTGTKDILPAAANRFHMHLFIDTSPTVAFPAFLRFAVASDGRIHPDVISYLNYDHSKLCTEPNGSPAFCRPRTWEAVSEHLYNELFDDEEKMIATCAAVGAGVGIEFFGWREHSKSLPDWKLIISADPEYSYEIPDSEEIRYALATPLALNIIEMLVTKNNTAIRALAEIANQLSDELLVVVIRTIRSHPRALVEMMMNSYLSSLAKRVTARV